MTKRETALAAAKDLAINFVYYDRRQDEDLTVKDLEALAKSIELSPEDVVKAFEYALREVWPR